MDAYFTTWMPASCSRECPEIDFHRRSSVEPGQAQLHGRSTCCAERGPEADDGEGLSVTGTIFAVLALSDSRSQQVWAAGVGNNRCSPLKPLLTDMKDSSHE